LLLRGKRASARRGRARFDDEKGAAGRRQPPRDPLLGEQMAG